MSVYPNHTVYRLGDVMIPIPRHRDVGERAARADAASQLRSAAIELKRTGMSVREWGKVLGVSYQRAAQLTSGARDPAS